MTSNSKPERSDREVLLLAVCIDPRGCGIGAGICPRCRVFKPFGDEPEDAWKSAEGQRRERQLQRAEACFDATTLH